MAIISEDYVNDETFKLLKEKGFDDSCCRFVVESDETYHRGAPTLQMAVKWLREIYNFHIWVEPNHDKEGLYNAHVKVGWWLNNWGGVGYNTYEKACEAAIKYCLENLI
jgi:hypothetical protein